MPKEKYNECMIYDYVTIHNLVLLLVPGLNEFNIVPDCFCLHCIVIKVRKRCSCV